MHLRLPLAVLLFLAGCSSTDPDGSGGRPDASAAGGVSSGGRDAGGASSGGRAAGGSASGGKVSTGGVGSGGKASGGAGGAGGGASAGGADSGTGGTPADCGPDLRFVMKAPSGGDYCVGKPQSCDSSWLVIVDPEGDVVSRGLPCRFDCATCESSPCPPPVCPVSTPLRDEGSSLTWSGDRWDTPGTCGEQQQCLSRTCAVAGIYRARFCAYTLPEGADGGDLACEMNASTTATCVEVPFEYPSTGEITGVLPSP